MTSMSKGAMVARLVERQTWRSLSSAASARQQEPALTRKALQRMKKADLARLAHDRAVDSSGTKNDLIRRLLIRDSTVAVPGQDPVDPSSTVQVQSAEFPTDFTKVLSKSIKGDKDAELPEEYMAKSWVSAFDTKVTHRGLKSNRARSVREPLQKTRTHGVFVAAETAGAQPVEENVPSTPAMDMPEDMDHQWVDAFDMKVSNRGARHDLLGSIEMDTVPLQDTNKVARTSFNTDEIPTSKDEGSNMKDGFPWDASATNSGHGNAESLPASSSRIPPKQHGSSSGDHIKLTQSSHQGQTVSGTSGHLRQSFESNTKDKSKLDSKVRDTVDSKPTSASRQEKPASDRASHSVNHGSRSSHKEHAGHDLNGRHSNDTSAPKERDTSNTSNSMGQVSSSSADTHSHLVSTPGSTLEKSSHARRGNSLPDTNDQDHSSYRTTKATAKHDTMSRLSQGNVSNQNATTDSSHTRKTHAESPPAADLSSPKRKARVSHARGSVANDRAASETMEARADVQPDASKADPAGRDRPSSRWVTHTVIGSGLLLWIVAGEQGVKRITDFFL